MGRVVRGLFATLLVLVLVALIAVGGLLGMVMGAGHPQLAGTVHLQGIAGDVTVVRDVNGITNITANTAHDLFFGQGYVHATERLWQMEIWRRAGAGRLSELFGESTLDQDRFIRAMDWRGAAQRDLDAATPEGLAVLQAYADGVNAYIATHQGSFGPAFTISGLLSGKGSGLDGYVPEPWTPLDTLTFAKVQAWGLGGNMDTEIFRMLTDARLGDPALTDQLFPPYSPDQPVIAAETSGTGSGAGSVTPAAKPTSVTALTDEETAAWAAIARLANAIPASIGLTPERGMVGDGGVGSNNWVVAPSHTTTGGALLANDPHLGFNMPSVWYVNGLHCRPVSDACPYDVSGVTFPGTPGVIAGHNARIAWGVTNVNPDVQDLVMEKVDPADPAKYVTATGSEPFTVRTETIKVKGGADVTMTVRETGHGPILNDVEPELTGGDILYALRWTALAKPDHVLEAFLGVDRATSFDQFRQALSVFGAPSQNFVFADVDGNIGYQMPGAVPVRTLADDHGLRPVPGWDGQHEWVSYIPFDQLPSVYNPPSGRIVTANNAVDGRGSFLGEEYDRGDRAARILQLIDEAGNGVSLDTFAAIQGDSVLLRAFRMQSSLGAIRPKPATADGQAVLEMVSGFDGNCITTSADCSAFVVFELALERAVFDDDLGNLARDYVGTDPADDNVAMWMANAAGQASPWWGSVKSGGGADARAVVSNALDTAGHWLRRELGNPSAWAWGRIHRVTFREATLGTSGIGPVEWLFDTGTYEVNGAAGAVNNTYYRQRKAYANDYDPTFTPVSTLGEIYAVTNGPSYRGLYDLANMDNSRIITTTGQSGAPFSLHNSDWVRPWLDNRTVAFPFSDAGVAGTTVATLTLTPSK